jgi:cellobiose-specific phosphotransferase system component IIB
MDLTQETLNDRDIVYSLIIEQCMGSFIAENISRQDIVLVGPQAKCLLEKNDSTLNSQHNAFALLVTTSLQLKDSSNIFKSGAKTPYLRLVFLLTITKLLMKSVGTEHDETAKTFVGEIRSTLIEPTFT